MTEVAIERLTKATPEAAEQLQALLTQLTSKAQQLDQAVVQRICDSSALYVARSNGTIVGTVCRVDMRAPVRTKCWIEDLVVDSAHRGEGIARKLMETAMAEAPMDAVSINLNSRITRVESHRLYQKLGFTMQDETRIWMREIER